MLPKGQLRLEGQSRARLLTTVNSNHNLYRKLSPPKNILCLNNDIPRPQNHIVTMNLLRSDIPLLSLLVTKQAICGQCFKVAPALQACRTSRYVAYCSFDCVEMDWMAEGGHMDICKGMKSLYGLVKKVPAAGRSSESRENELVSLIPISIPFLAWLVSDFLAD